MKDVRVEIDAISFNAMLSGCAKVGDLAGAVKWLQTMQEEHLEPNAITYASVIGACCKAHEIVEAVKWLETAD